jgi:phage terminase large subunit-like protein
MLRNELAAFVRSLPLEDRILLFEREPKIASALLHDWHYWARDDQLLPPSMFPGGGAITWLPLAGRGWGKTRVGAETVIDEVKSGRSKMIALVAETAADARKVMVEGISGILACSDPKFMPEYEPSKRQLTWPNGAMAFTYNAVEPGQLRGPQHDFAWADELAKWRYAQETWDNLQFGLRIGTHPRQIVTTTPRPIPIIRELVADPTTHVTKGRTLDNEANLAASFIKQIRKRYEGTRLGRQELEAEILDDMPGALWTRALIEKALCLDPPPLRRIVVSIDPSGASASDAEKKRRAKGGEVEDGPNEIGIIVAGADEDDNGYILDDLTMTGSPEQWAKKAVNAFYKHKADLIVAERNFGGDMVRAVIAATDDRVPVKMVHASRGKFLRAEPIAALYEQGRVKHVGTFAELEDQMCLISPSGYAGRGSPDRLDASVWAITELTLNAAPRPISGR